MDLAIGNGFSELSFTEIEMIEGRGFWTSVLFGAVVAITVVASCGSLAPVVIPLVKVAVTTKVIVCVSFAGAAVNVVARSGSKALGLNLW